MLGPREPSGPPPPPTAVSEVWAEASAGLTATMGLWGQAAPPRQRAPSPRRWSQPCRCACHFCFCSRCEWGRASPRDHPLHAGARLLSTHTCQWGPSV